MNPQGSLPNPFNISFEIPPLPSLSLMNNGGDPSSISNEFNFFSSLKPNKS
jgi:hypothetical protein